MEAYIITGKTSSGKTTLCNEIIKNKEECLHKVIFTTTRPPRDGEVDGQDYHFISLDEFVSQMELGEIIHGASYGEWLYGIRGKDVSESKTNVIVANPTELDELEEVFSCTSVYVSESDKVRALRYLNREQDVDVLEMARRILADEKDYQYIEELVDFCGSYEECLNFLLGGGANGSMD